MHPNLHAVDAVAGLRILLTHNSGLAGPPASLFAVLSVTALFNSGGMIGAMPAPHAGFLSDEEDGAEGVDVVWDDEIAGAWQRSDLWLACVFATECCVEQKKKKKRKPSG